MFACENCGKGWPSTHAAERCCADDYYPADGGRHHRGH